MTDIYGSPWEGEIDKISSVKWEWGWEEGQREGGKGGEHEGMGRSSWEDRERKQGKRYLFSLKDSSKYHLECVLSSHKFLWLVFIKESFLANSTDRSFDWVQ